MFPILIFSTIAIATVASLHGGVPLNYSGFIISLSVLKLVAAVLLPMLQQLITFQGSIASFDRVQAYLVEEGDQSPNNARQPDGPEEEHGLLTTGEFGDSFELEEDVLKCHGNKVFDIADADFGYGQGQPILRDITLTISKGSFSTIIGKVGCGKSVMLQSLVLEVPALRGRVKRNHHRVSFCSLPVWLRNTSVRENIMGESAFEEEWYRRVVWACGLEQDLRELANGHSTSVGTNGMALSGGQRNRVALARSIYARNPVLVIDDVLSGLDNTTKSLVYTRVFGSEGLLRQMDCTTVLATHSKLGIAESDRVIVMSEGRIIADGHYLSLKQTPGLWDTYFENDSNRPEQDSRDRDYHQENSEKEAPDEITEVQANSDVDWKRKGSSGTLLSYLKGVGTTRMAIYLALMTATYTANAIQYMWVNTLLKRSISVLLLRRNISIFTGISLSSFFLTVIFLVYFFRGLCPRSGLKLHAKQLAILMRAHFTATTIKDTGYITNLFSQDTAIVDRLLPILWLNISTGKWSSKNPVCNTAD